MQNYQKSNNNRSREVSFPFFSSVELLNYKLNAAMDKYQPYSWVPVARRPWILTGVSPPPLWLPPNTINPEQVLHHYRYSQGRNEGTGTVPSFIVPVLCISFLSKRNSTEPFFWLQTVNALNSHETGYSLTAGRCRDPRSSAPSLSSFL